MRKNKDAPFPKSRMSLATPKSNAQDTIKNIRREPSDCDQGCKSVGIVEKDKMLANIPSEHLARVTSSVNIMLEVVTKHYLYIFAVLSFGFYVGGIADLRGVGSYV